MSTRLRYDSTYQAKLSHGYDYDVWQCEMTGRKVNDKNSLAKPMKPGGVCWWLGIRFGLYRLKCVRLGL